MPPNPTSTGSSKPLVMFFKITLFLIYFCLFQKNLCGYVLYFCLVEEFLWGYILFGKFSVGAIYMFVLSIKKMWVSCWLKVGNWCIRPRRREQADPSVLLLAREFREYVFMEILYIVCMLDWLLLCRMFVCVKSWELIIFFSFFWINVVSKMMIFARFNFVICVWFC